MTTEHLISADSRVAVRLGAIRERVPSAVQDAFGPVKGDWRPISDFPHPAITWPESRQIVDRQCSDAERELICSRNASRIYGL